MGRMGEDDDDDEDLPVRSKQSEHNEPGWVRHTISKTVQHRMERFRQKQRNCDELSQPGSVDLADQFCELD